jgi:hypothetical protein
MIPTMADREPIGEVDPEFGDSFSQTRWRFSSPD